jgi:hypothetical protein
MGYNACIVVLLDRLDEIERDPQFGRKLADAVRGFDQSGKHPRGRPSLPGQTQVVSVDHSSALQVVVVEGNTGRRLASAGDLRADAGLVAEIERLFNLAPGSLRQFAELDRVKKRAGLESLLRERRKTR